MKPFRTCYDDDVLCTTQCFHECQQVSVKLKRQCTNKRASNNGVMNQVNGIAAVRSAVRRFRRCGQIGPSQILRVGERSQVGSTQKTPRGEGDASESDIDWSANNWMIPANVLYT